MLAYCFRLTRARRRAQLQRGRRGQLHEARDGGEHGAAHRFHGALQALREEQRHEWQRAGEHTLVHYRLLQQTEQQTLQHVIGF